MSLPAPTAQPDRRQRGFALLITITLLAFLVLLLVSLASLTRVETQVASNTQQLAQARQNALTALNIALGELQKYAGPDQRATARADIEATSVRDGSRRWTGVWGNANNPQSDIASAPVPLQWLVSGNEATAFNPATQVTNNASAFGQVSNAAATAASRVFTPAQPITGLSAAATVNTAVTVNNRPATLLVGPGTSEGIDNYVVAPLRNIEVPQSSLPGMGTGSTLVPVGRYAWWVGDEGVKARLNTVDPYVTPTPAMIAADVDPQIDSVFRLMLPQRIGIESVPGFGNFPINTDLARRVLSPEQAAIADSALTPAASQARFHDLTGSSLGVLADPRAGGLKRDLTYAFAQSLTNFRSSLGLNAGGPTPLIPTSVMPLTEHGPTWDQLHSYGNLNGSAPVNPRPQTATEHGIYPILSQARIAFGGTTAPGAQADHQQFIVHIYPTFVLANPYSAPIAPAKYRVRIDIATGAFLSAYIGQANTPFWRRTLQQMFEGQVFELDCTEPLAPGEARIFTLTSSPADETWAPVKTYALMNDWDAGAAKITLNTATQGGSEVPNNVLYRSGSGAGNGQGIHMVFGDRTSETPSPSWAGDGGTYTGYRIGSTQNGQGAGGTLSFTLTNDVDVVLQRMENLGFPGWVITQYGIRGSGTTPATFVPPGPDNRQGLLLFRLAESGNFRASGTNNDAPVSRFPYYAQMNWRAPLLSRPAFLSGGGTPDSIIAFTQDWKVGGVSFSRWVRPHPAPDKLLTHVEWNGGVGTNTSLPQARTEWRAFDVPNANAGLVSIGQLQHFNAGGHLNGMIYPAPASPLGAARPSANNQLRPRYVANPYPIGNSRAHPNVERTAVRRLNSNEPYYDQSYLLNRVLSDGYFFSTYPQSGAVDLDSDRLPNPRMSPFRAELQNDDVTVFRGGSFAPENARLAARNLLLEGAFNVNSTSVEAWRALLTSFQGARFNGETVTGAFVRSVRQTAGSAAATDGVSADAWNGFRNLTTTQIDELAARIVEQIQLRGVSLSTADFINRKLALDDTGLAGVFQAAIDAADQSPIAAARINDHFPNSLQNAGNSTVTPLTPNVPTTASPYHFAAHVAKHSLEGIAGWLTQADLVQALAPVLSARSDTFRVRTYGETVNPVTGDVVGRAWCEAIVQRLPDYVSPADDARVSPGDLTDGLNQQFGRRFSVVSFRWLTPNDI